MTDLMSSPSIVATGQTVRKSKITLVLVVVAMFALLLAWLANANDSTDTTLSLKNPNEWGAQALGRVASAQGLELREIERLGAAQITRPDWTTLVIASSEILTSSQRDSIRAYPGDLVILGTGWGFLETFRLDAEITAQQFGANDDPASLLAQCDDPHALAAETLSNTGALFAGEASSAGAACFRADDKFLTFSFEERGRTVTLIANPFIASNSQVARDGNAAYLLRVIGENPRAVWYVGNIYDTSTLTWTSPEGASSGGDGSLNRVSADVLPPGFGNLIYALVLALVVVAWWRARRFGALVTEPLPVVVRASESTRGRARMYRASRAYGRAGAGLRAAAASRMGKRIGIPRAATKDALLNGLTSATARNRNEIEQLLYGPPPASEAKLTELALELDKLESEVHRP